MVILSSWQQHAANTNFSTNKFEFLHYSTSPLKRYWEAPQIQITMKLRS